MVRPSAPICAVPGCGKQSRSPGSLHCEAHYCRQRRNGDLQRRLSRRPIIEHSGGYLRRFSPDHVLADSKGYVYEHRFVLHAHRGMGPFSCHVCGARQSWARMHVDHLDGDPRNNEISNLAPACPRCNQGRGIGRMTKAMRERGRQYTVDGRTMCLSEWAKDAGLPRTTLSRRIAEGWAIQDAISTPSGPSGAKRRQSAA